MLNNMVKSKQLRWIFILLPLMQFFVFVSKAQTIWLGGTTAWATTTNWSTGVVPTSTTDVVINSGVTNMPIISATGTYTIQSLTINSGATLTINSSRALTVAGLSGSGSLINNGAITVGDANNLSTQFDGVISGTGTVSKAGTGTLTITGTNTYTGATAIAAGTIAIGSATATLGANSATTVTGILELNGNSLELGSIAGAGTIKTSAGGTVYLTSGGNNTSTTFSGVIGNIGDELWVVKKGSGALTLSGANAYSGGTQIMAGTLSVGTISNGGISSNLGASDTNPGRLIFSGGTLTVTGTTVTTDRGFQINDGSSTINISGTTTFSGAVTSSISTAATFNKTGAGTLVLSGSSSHDAAMTIAGGTLRLGSDQGLGSTVGATTIASGAIVDLNGFSTAEQFAISGSLVNNSASAATASGGITLTTAAAAIIGGTGNVTSTGIISGTGTLQKTGTGTWTLNGANTYSAATTVTAGTLQLGNNGALGTTTATTIALNAFVDLNGYTTAELFTISGSLVNNSGTPVTASGNITLTTAAIIGGTGDATVSGIISSTGTLTKTGAGTWTINGANTYSGATTISTGTIKLGASTATLGPIANSAITVTGTLDLNGFNLEVGSIAGAGIITSSGAGNVTLTVGANNGTTTFSGVINDGSGQLGLVKKGTGTSTLSGNNLYSGNTSVNVGTIKLGSNDGLGATSGTTTIASGALVDLSGFATAEPFTVSGSLVNTSGTASTASGNISLSTAAIFGGTGSATASGVVSGSGTFSKTGTGTWTLSGINTYSGSTTVSAGTLRFDNNDALGSTSATTIASGALLDLNGYTLSKPITLSGSLVNNGVTAATASAAITLTTAGILGGTGEATASGIISSTGTLSKTGTGSWTLSGSNTYSGTTTVSGGTLKLGNNLALGTTAATTISSGAILDLNGYSTTEPFTIIGSLVNNSSTAAGTSGAITLSGAAIIGGSGDVTASGVISGTGTLEKKDAGVWYLTGTNTYSGATTVTGGTFKLGNNAALGTTASTTIRSGAFVDLNGHTTAEIFVISGSLLNNSTTAATASGTISLSTAAIFGGSGNATISGVISSTGTLTKSGAGTWTLTATNTYSGATTVSAGTLKLGNNAALGSAVATTISLGAIVDLNGFTTSEPFTVSGSLVNNSGTTSTASAAMSLSGAAIFGGSGNATVSGIISGTGTLQKTGSGTWTLSGANTYSGNSTISAGVLKLGNNAGLGSSVSTTIVSGATVDLNGFTSIEQFVISGSLVNNSGTASTASGTISLSGSATFGGTGNATLSGIISGSGSLTKTGIGTFTLSATNTFSGGVTINAGTISVATIGNGGVAGNLGQATNAAANLVLGGGQLTYTGVTASTDRNITLTANTVSQINISVTATTLTVSGATTNTTGGFTKEGTGTLTFTGTNLHTGITYKNAGTLNSGAGVTTIAAGQTMYVAVGQTITIPAGSTLTNNGTVEVDGTLNITGSFVNTGNIIGIGTYVFNGTIAQTIPGALTYPTLTVSNTAGATLGGHLTASGQLTVGTSTSIQLSGYNLTASSLAGAGNIANAGTCAVLSINGNTNTTYSGVISGCTGLSKSGTGILTLTGTNTYTGVTTIAGGTISVATIGNGGTAGNLGAATNNASNLVLSGGTLSYSGVTASTDRNVTLTSGTTSIIEVTVLANTLTWTGILSSSGAINKTGAGTLLLSGTNTYTGTTTLSAGTLSVSTIGNGGTAGNLGAASNAATNLVFNGGTLLYTGSTASTDRNFILNNATTSTINIAANTLTWTGASTSTTGGFTKSGAGTLVWSGANAYSGLTTISAGTVQLGHSSALGTSASTTISSGATLELNGNSTAEIMTISGTVTNSTGTAALSGAITLTTAAIISGTGNITSTGNVSGSGTLQKTGNGTLTMGGTNTFTGATTISAGIVKLGSTSAFGTTAGGISIISGAALDLNGITYANAEAMTIRGDGLASGGVIMNSSPVAATYPGTITLGSASSIVGETGSINISSTSAITGAFALTLGGSVGGTIVSATNIGAGTLTKVGTGTWKLGGNSTFTGATTITAGVVRLGRSISGTTTSGPLGTNAGTTTISSGATLDFNGYSLTSSATESIIPSGTGYNNGGAITNTSTTASAFSGTINSTSGADYVISGTGQITFNGVISGNNAITKTGSNVVIFAAANTYTGSTTISEGTLRVAVINLTSTTSGNLGNNSSIILDGGTLSHSGSTVTNNRPILLANAKSSGLEVLNSATVSTFSGVFSGTGSLNKKGPGRLVLSATNTFTGSVTVATGSLSLATIGAAGANGNAGAGSGFQLSGGILIYSGATSSTDRTVSLTPSTTSTINVSTSGIVLSVTGVVSGGGALKVANHASGTLELTGSNTYTGATTLTTGILKVSELANGGSNSSIGASSNAASNLILGTGTLLYTGASASTDRNFTLGSATTTTFNIENSASTLTFAGSSGTSTGRLTKTGTGTLALTGINKHTGVTTLTAGTLGVSTINNGGVAGALGAATNAAANLVFNGGTLSYTGTTASTNRNFTINSALQATFNVANASTNLTWAGISTTNTGGITKTGVGTLTLSGLNNYSGVTYINEGTVKLGNQKVNVRRTTGSNNINSGPLGTGGVDGDLTMSRGTIVADGATLDYNGYALGTTGYTYSSTSGYRTYRYYENVTISGTGVGGAGAIINGSAKTISSNLSSTYLGADATIGGTGNYPLIYYSGSATLSKKGNNTVTFNSVSAVTGNIVVDGGILKLAAASNVLGGTTGTTTINAGATLDLNAKALTVVETINLNGSGYNGVGALYNSSTTASSSACLINLGSETSIGGLGNITQSGTISGTGSLIKIGTKTLTLSASTTNNFTGFTTISGGILAIANFANLGSSGNSASNLVFDGGTLSYTGNTATLARSFTVADGKTSIFNTSAAAAQIITLTGSSTGGGTLTKSGTATLLVQGTLGHTGGTNGSAGIIELANVSNDALSDSGPYIFAGSTFKTKAGGGDESAGAINLTNSSIFTFGSTTAAHSINFASSAANRFRDGKLISISNWVKGTRNADSSFNSGAFGKIFVGSNNAGLTPQQRAKIRFVINTNISSLKYLTFPDVFSSGTTLKRFYSLSAEQLSTGELVPAVPRPIMDIQGTDGYDTVCLNQTKTYNYTIYNIGDIDAANVNVTSDNPNFVIGAKTGSTTVTAITTIVDGTTSTPGSSITFPVVFTSGSVTGTQTLRLITSSTTSRTDNDTLVLEVYVTPPPTFTSSTGGGACYNDQFATLSATSSGGSYISWHTSLTPTAGDTAFIGNPFIIDPLTATTTYYAQANLGSCNTTTGRTAVTAILNSPATDASITADAATVCSSGTANIAVTINGGTGPFTLIYNDGLQDIMVPNYVSGTNIPVTITSSTTFTISSLTDALGCDVEDISTNGSVAIDVITSVGGTPVADQSAVCPGNEVTLTLLGYDGDAFQWQQSTNGTSNWTNVTGGTGATTDVYTTPTLTSTLYYRAAVTNSICAAAYSDVLTATVNASVGGTIAADSICIGNNTTLTLNGYAGNSFIWQQSDDGINFEQVTGGSGSATATYTTPNLYVSKYYQVVVTNDICDAASSTSALVTVSPLSVAGTIAGTYTQVCTGTNTNTLTLSDYVGSIQWQSSNSLNGTYTNLAGQTAATLDITNLTVNTYYRAVVTSGDCSSATTDPFEVEVTPVSVSGAITGDGIVCSGTNSSTLVLTGYTGELQWQMSTDYGVTFSDINDSTSATLVASNLNQSTYYQVVVTSGACPAVNTAAVLIDVTNSDAPTNISGTDEICTGGSTTLTAATACANSSSTFIWYAGGYGGDAYEEGWDATSSITSIVGPITINNNTGGVLNITSTGVDPQLYMRSLGSFDPAVYKYINMRYRVTSGSASIAQFFLLTNTVPNAIGGFVGSGTLISDNNWHTVSIDISSQTSNGNITGWRFDPMTGAGVTMDIDFIQLGTGRIIGDSASIAVSPTVTTTYYVNKKGAGVSTDFITRTVTVNAIPQPTFTSEPGATACANTDLLYITESGKTNYIWTIPGTSGTDYTIVSGGTPTDNTLSIKWLTAGSKTVTINYTLGCAASTATSSIPTMVSASSVGGSATALAATLCSGNATSINLTGYTGTIQWQQSTDGVSDWTDVTAGSGITSASYTTPNLNTSTYYRAVVTNNVCDGDTSNVLLIVVNDAPTPANAGTDMTSSVTCGLTTVTLSGNTPSIGTGTWTIINGLGGSITDANSATPNFSGTAGASYTLRWTIANSTCTSSDDVLITFNQNPTAASAGADQTGSATCGLTSITLAGNAPSLGTGVWSVVSGSGGTFANASSPTSSFSGTAGTSYTLRWSISNSPCVTSTDDVLISINQNPTTANAGPDQNVSASGGVISATLAGNSPAVGTGLWSITSGTGGTINSPTNPASTFTGSSGSGYTLRWTITSGACTSYDEMLVSSGYIWTGSGGNNLWDNPANWSTGLPPTVGAEITVGSGNLVLNVDYQVTGTFTMSGASTLTVNPGKTLSISSTGVVDFGGKLVTFKSDATGTGQLGIVAGTLTGATNVVAERHVPSGKRAFRFFSSSVTTTSSIRDNWMEGATPAVGNLYPYRTQSVYNPNPGYGTLITGSGGAANGFDASETNAASLFTFNNSTGAWADVTSTAGTIAAGRAYRMLVRGDRSYNIMASALPTPTQTVLRTRGTLGTGTMTSGVQLPALNQSTGGWSLVGNPYQSVVDMSAASVVKTNLTDYYYVWDPRMGTRGAYVAYNYVTSTSANVSSGVNKYVQPGQAFFVQSSAAGSAIQFTEAGKGAASNQTATFGKNDGKGGMPGNEGYKIEATQQRNEVTQTGGFASLSMLLYETDSLTKGGTPADATRVLFAATYSNNVDLKDGRKFTNLDETMAVKQNNTLLSMELRALPDTGTVLPLSITQYRATKYTLRVYWDRMLTDSTRRAYLKDKFTAKEYMIDRGGNYIDLAYTITSDAKSSAADRFDIVFKTVANVVTAVTNYSNGDYVRTYPNPVINLMKVEFKLGMQRELTLKVYDMSGREVLEQKKIKSGDQVNMSRLLRGIYQYQLLEKTGKLLMAEKLLKN